MAIPTTCSDGVNCGMEYLPKISLLLVHIYGAHLHIYLARFFYIALQLRLCRLCTYVEHKKDTSGHDIHLQKCLVMVMCLPFCASLSFDD